MSPKAKNIVSYLDHPFLFLITIWAGTVALTALAVWGLKASGRMPGLLALLQGGKS